MYNPCIYLHWIYQSVFSLKTLADMVEIMALPNCMLTYSVTADKTHT